MALETTSASQVKDFRACNRLWFYTRVLKQRAPQTEAQSRGTTVHGALEAHLKSGEIEQDILERARSLGLTKKILDEYIAAMLPFVGKPGEGLTEHRDEMPTYEGGPKFVLIVDHAREVALQSGEAIPQIDDLKTTSDFRYCKTPDELSKDAQMISYGKWAVWRLFEQERRTPPNFVSLRHVYVRTRGKCVATARDTLVTPAHIEEQWQTILDDVRAMATLAASNDSALRLTGEALDPATVPATTTDHCSAYGGCFFRSKCFGALYDGSRPFMSLFNKNNTEKKMDSEPRLSLADRMRARAAAAGTAPAPAAPAAPAAAAPAAPAAAAPAAPAAAAPAAPAAAAPAAPTQTLCDDRNTMLNVSCTLVPHDGDHESRDPKSGVVVFWSPDRARFGTGPSQNWSTKVPPAPAAAASDVPNILPPDAASRTTTSAEVEAQGAPRTRKRRSATAPEGAADAAPAVTFGTATTAAPAAAVVVIGSPPVAVAGVCPLEILYIDCFPVKSGVTPVLAEGLIAELAAEAAKAAEMPDWRLVEFGKGKGAMAVILRERLAQIPRELVVSTLVPGSDVVIEVLAPHAKKIIRALRG